MAQYQKEYRARNVERLREYERERHRTQPERSRQARLKIHGLTLDEYENMVVTQCAACALCGRAGGDVTTKSDRLYVDHDHETGKVRSLLCSECNSGLGKFRDDTTLLGRAIAYLTE